MSDPDTYLSRAYSLSNDPSAAETLYDEWATDYDAHLSSFEYAFPAHAAKILLSALKTPSTPGDGGPRRILDAGCGTGLVARAIVNQMGDGGSGGKSKLDLHGIDISNGMLDIARQTGLYSKLWRTDMTLPLHDVEDGSYDAAVCVGTFTTGHVGAVPAIGELVRSVRDDGGMLVFSVLPNLWDSEFEAAVMAMQKNGAITEVKVEQVGVMKGGTREGLIVTLRKAPP